MTLKRRIQRLEIGSGYATVEDLLEQIDAEDRGEKVQPLNRPLHPQLVRFLEESGDEE